jgi:hypothetical protein
MLKQLVIIPLIGVHSFCFGQNEIHSHRNQFQFQFALGLQPIHLKASEVDFFYADGDVNSSYPVDTISSDYLLQNQYFNTCFSLGVGYFISDKLRLSLSISPHVFSFLPNSAKNGKVYGVHFDLGADYFHTVTKRFSLSLGLSAKAILGGFGITSGGPSKKPYLLVNGFQLYDSDIGFHIVETNWAINPKFGLHYRLGKRLMFNANVAFQWVFARTGHMNFAGLLQDGSVKWNRMDFGDQRVKLFIDEAEIVPDNLHLLPYHFSGLNVEFGVNFQLGKIR